MKVIAEDALLPKATRLTEQANQESVWSREAS